MAIYSALKKDHDEVKEILQKLEKNPNDDNAISQLKEELQAHNPAEEKVFYKPLGKLLGKLNIIVNTGEKEHNAAMDLIDR